MTFLTPAKRLDRRVSRILLLLLLLAGGVLRLMRLGWDDGHHLHPDERFISMVEEQLAFPDDAAEFFDSSRSRLNPYNAGHGSFVYGTLPMFLAKAAGGLLGKRGYDGTYLVGRALSGLFDLFSVWLTYLLARRAAPERGRGMALVAAGLLAFCPLAIQLSHFWAVDTFLAAFTSATLLSAVRIARGRSGLLGMASGGLALGLAAACKITALALLAPVGVALLVLAAREGALRDARALAVGAARTAGRLLLIVAVAAVAVRAALPYAFAGPSFFSFALDPRYVADINRLSELSRSVAGFPPAFQWAGRTIFFPLKNLVLWGAGPFFGLAALAGFVGALATLWKRLLSPQLPLLVHSLFILAYHGFANVKSLRYFYPAYPALAVLAALFLAWLARRGDPRRPMTISSRLRRLVPALALASTFLWAIAFAAIYTRPVTRVAASRWIYQNVPPPARFANEAWDDGLPFPVPEYDVGAYAGPQLSLIDPDSAEKAENLVRALEKSDWIAVTSNRIYANVTRVPDVFPMSRAYYSALFEGRLGFDLVADFRSYPTLGPLTFPDDSAEEQFTVYDHPRVLLFKKNKSFSAPRVRRMLLAAIPTTPPTMHDWEKSPRKLRRVAAPVLPPRPGEEAAVRAVAARSELSVGSVGAAVIWYGALLLLGALAFPLVHRLFSRLEDRGAGLARLVGLAAATYLASFSVRAGLLRHGRGAVLLGVALLVLTSLLFGWKHRRALRDFLRARWRPILEGEGVFAAGYLLFLAVRAANPEIYWGEKPMDFSLLNILVRTPTLPPSDPWFAGAPLYYYAFGHQMIAFLTLLTGLSTRYTFNLAFGFLGGVTLQAAFSLARNWGGTRRAGIAGAAFALLIGNLSGFRLWLQPASEAVGRALRPLDWHYFWATSRVIENTINEYPFWSLLFADLHAHVLAMPLFLLVAACALLFVRAHTESAPLRARVACAAALGLAAAVQALTNAWDVPLLAGLLPLAAVVSAWDGRRFRAASLGRAALGLLVAFAAAVLAAAPLWTRAGGMPGIGWTQERMKGVDILTVFGLFLFLALAWWLARVMGELAAKGVSPLPRRALAALIAALLLFLGIKFPLLFCVLTVLLLLFAALFLAQSAGVRLAAAFAAAAAFLILFAERAYIYDHMNTVFKLFFEAWLLFALSAAVLVFGIGNGRFGNWGLAPRVVFFLLLAGALFTSVTAARGALFIPGNPSRQHSGPKPAPTLDGLAYLERARPGEYRAVLWLRREIEGTPVILEAQGPSYQDFGRVSMLTGLPTLLGWDYHVKQRGNSDAEIETRRAAVKHIYSSPSVEQIEGLLRKYHVGYVYVGWLEREIYPAAGLKKFETGKELFELAYENREVRIHRVVGGDTQDVLLPAREALPAPAGATGDEPEESPSFLESAAPDAIPYGGMREPRDGDVDRQGRLWIADFGNSRLRVFDRNGGYLGGWGGRGNGTYGLREPCAVTISGEDLYIADTWNGRVQGFALDGTWKAKAAGLYGPRGVAASPDGKVWVTDTGNNRVLVYGADLAQPRVIGPKGEKPGQFLAPVGISAGPRGDIYVADIGNRRIQIFEPDGRFRAAWSFPGWREPNEAHLEVDEDGTVYATDPVAQTLLAFDDSGKVVRTFDSDDAGEHFSRPTGIALDRKNRILYIINSGNNTVSKISGPLRKYGGIRAALHPRPLRCTPCGVPPLGTPRSHALRAWRIAALGASPYLRSRPLKLSEGKR